VYGKSLGVKFTKTNTRNYGMQAFQVTLLCGDSRKYSPTIVTSGPIYLGASSGTGFGFPLAFPFGYGGLTITSGGTITPGGNRTTPGLYVVTGPILSGWQIVNDAIGTAWTFNTALNAGESLYINPMYRTVRLGQNGPSRRGNMTGLWWWLLPGTTSFRLLGAGGTAGVTNLTITAQPAWR
jgi:hypothetical protein